MSDLIANEAQKEYLNKNSQTEDVFTGADALRVDEITAFEIHIEIASRCILRCIHCSNHGRVAINPLHEEHARDLIGAPFFRQIPCQNHIYVCLTGGEPLLSDNIEQTIATAKAWRQTMTVGIFTSGCTNKGLRSPVPLNPEKAARLCKAGLSFAYVSLYSLHQPDHDAITGIVGSHAATLATMRTLLSVGIDVRVHFVPMKTNLQALPDIITGADTLGISEIRILRLVRHGQASSNWEQIGLTLKEQEDTVLDALSQVRRQTQKVKVTAAAFPSITNCRPFPVGDKCQAGIHLLYINQDGNVFPCACAKRNSNAALTNVLEASDFWKNHAPSKLCHPACRQDVHS